MSNYTFKAGSQKGFDNFALQLAGYTVLGAILIFFIPIVGSLIGAFVGWIVGLFFGETMMGVLSAFGVNVEGLEPWHIGMFLGFVSGFFKTSVSRKE